MKFWRVILDFYINTSIHVAIAVFSLVQITKLSLNISTNINLDYFIFFGTILGYNFLKYFEVFWNRVFTIKKKIDIVIVSFFSLIGLIFNLLNVEQMFLIEFLKIAFVVLAYPFFRKYWFLKMFVVAFCVTYITAYIIGLQFKTNLVYFVQRFIIIICLLIPPEICDLELDAKTIKTLPYIIGIGNLKIIGYLLLIIMCNINFYFLNVNLEITIAIVIAIFIFYADNKVSKYYTSFWVESIPIIWWLFLLHSRIL